MSPLNEGPEWTTRHERAEGWVKCPLFWPGDAEAVAKGRPTELWVEALMPRCNTQGALGPCCGKCAQAHAPAEGQAEWLTADLVFEMDTILFRRILARAAIVPGPPARPKSQADAEGPQLSMFEAWRR